MSTSTRCARLRVDHRQPADRRQLALARVVDLHGHHGVARRQRGQRPRPVGGPGEVGHDDDEAARARQAPDPHQRQLERLAARCRRRRLPRPARAAAPTRAPRPPRGGSSAALGPPKVSRPTRPPRRTASAPSTSTTPSATSLFSRSAVPNAIDGDTSTREPGGQQPLGHVLADVRDAGAGGRRRVDLAHVVAGLVGAQLRQLGARADPGAAVFPRADPADAPYEGEVERLHQGAGHRAGSLAARPAGASLRRSRRQRLRCRPSAGRARARPPGSARAGRPDARPRSAPRS